MKISSLIALICICCSLHLPAQTFVNFKDTINHFSINIPVGWKYGINKNLPSIKLLAYRVPQGAADTSKINFNVNVLETPGKDLNKTFADFIQYLPEAKAYQLIDSGEIIINNTKCKWLIEKHENDFNSHVQTHNYDIVAIKNGKTYIIIMVSLSYLFADTKPLFDKIATSFMLL